MTMTRPAVIRLTVAVPLALAVLFSVPVQRGGAGTTIARAGSIHSLGANASLHRMSNGKIAVAGGFSGRYLEGHLDVINPDGSGLRRLVRCQIHGCHISDPVWSPDGRRIAFLRGVPALHSKVSVSVNVMNANGSGERRLASCVTSYDLFCGFLAWSPDGTRLVMARSSLAHGLADESLYVLDLKTGGVRRLTAQISGMGDVDLFPAWSPDGSRIAFGRTLCTRAGTCLLSPYIVNADGRGLRRLSALSGHSPQGGPLWSPDGRTIAFIGSNAIYAVNPDGSHLRRLVPASRPYNLNVPNIVLTSWSHDGRHILYFRFPSGSRGAELWMMNASGTGQRRFSLAIHPGFGDNPIWSPDGQRIAFIQAFSMNPLGPGAFVMDADGGHLHRLMTTGEELAWQPIP